jgi:multidrug efflux pump subunit AcrB
MKTTRAPARRPAGPRRPPPLAGHVLNLLIAIAGLAAILAVEVRELPNVDRPLVNVRATLPGASPETMDAEVTAILEGAVARVSGCSISAPRARRTARGSRRVPPGTDIDRAAADVREAVSRVARDLPEDLEQLAVYKADEDAEEIVRIAVSQSDRLQRGGADAHRREGHRPGVHLPARRRRRAPVRQPRAGAARDRRSPAPDQLRPHGGDVANVLRQAPLDVPAGSFRTGDQQLLVRADASVVTEDGGGGDDHPRPGAHRRCRRR